MKFDWDPVKSLWLKSNRGVSFRDVKKWNYLCRKNHPSRRGQILLFFENEGYIWVAPGVEAKGVFFLKTLYASRKYTRKFRKGELS